MIVLLMQTFSINFHRPDFLDCSDSSGYGDKCSIFAMLHDPENSDDVAEHAQALAFISVNIKRVFQNVKQTVS